tara:strand:- start:214159 stop:217068 length:2910 start_codon:yes stop_codon:yes gene_type:complete
LSIEANIYKTGVELLSHKEIKSSILNLKSWSTALMDKMMEHESFRLAALRFTDVAPSLRTDDEFMQHLNAYFKDVSGVSNFIGKGIPGQGLLGKVIAPVGRQNIKSMAKTFIAGETLADGIKTFEKLHKEGIACSIDLLGEAVITKAEAESFMQGYHNAIREISAASKTWDTAHYKENDSISHISRANVSIKLSALYEFTSATAHADSKEALCKRMGELLDTAMACEAFINVDVEQYEILPLTLDVFETVLMQEKYKNYPHIGIVCQAYLRDGEKTLKRLINFAQKRGTTFSIRLVKGAYWDYEQAHAEQKNWPCPVFNLKEDTDANYERLTQILIGAFPHVRPCIGSHNARSLANAIELAKEAGLEKADIEFQALFGMANHFRNALRDKGYRVRQYCPVGEFIPGMSYLVRRLLENTANQSFLRMQGQADIDVDTLLKAPIFGHETEHKPVNAFANAAEKDFSLAQNRARAEQALTAFKVRLPLNVGKKTKESISNACPWHTDIKVSHVYCTSLNDTKKAIQTAKTAQATWGALSIEERAQILEKAADICERDWDELFGLQVYEAGKDWVSADADICEAIDFMRYYARQIRTLEGNLQPHSLWGESNKTIYEAKGVAAVIAPWNFPLAISVGMTSAALVTGNAVLYKPAEQTSANGEKMVKIFHEAGVPEDILHFLPGKGAVVGAEIVQHKDTNVIAFTGSRPVGLGILEEAGKLTKGQAHVKKCVIEMGGKNAIIVDSSADLDEAIPGIVHSAFAFQGQKCSACSRVIVIGSAYEPFIDRLKEVVSNLRIGAATHPEFDLNAVIDKTAQEKCEHYIKIGKKDGKLLAHTPLNKGLSGHFVSPHVFTDLKADSKLTTDEVFGPVLAVYTAKNIEEAVSMALDNDYALTGALYSRNPETIDYAKTHFKVGNLYINRGSTGALVGRQPFGGAGLSGTGTKAGGPDYLLHFLEPRVITENTMRRGYAPKDA